MFGHEAGGGSILALLAASSTRGLFHRAWVMSGFPVFNTSLKQAQQDNTVFFKLVYIFYNRSFSSKIHILAGWRSILIWGWGGAVRYNLIAEREIRVHILILVSFFFNLLPSNCIFSESGCNVGTVNQQWQCLQNLTPEQVIDAIPWHPYPSWGRSHDNDLPDVDHKQGPIAVIDGELLRHIPPKVTWEGRFTSELKSWVSDKLES